MQLPGSRGQQVRDFLFDASGTITTGGTPQLIIPEHPFRTSLYLQNLSSTIMFVEFGGARATATLTSGVVTSVAVTNAGFGYTVPPRVRFYGGGDTSKNPNYLGPGLPGIQGPSKVASGRAVLTAGAVSSIIVDNGGANYKEAPYVFLQGSEQDPYGAAIPSATSGIALLVSGGSIVIIDSTVCPTDAVSIFCSASSAAFTCKYTCGV